MGAGATFRGAQLPIVSTKMARTSVRAMIRVML